MTSNSERHNPVAKFAATLPEVVCLSNKGTQVRSLTRSKIPLEGGCQSWWIYNVSMESSQYKRYLRDSPCATRHLVSLRAISPGLPSSHSFPIKAWRSVSPRSARFDASFSVTARPSSLANYRRYNNASPTPIKSNDSFRATLVGLSVSGVGGGIVLATKQQQRAVRQGRFT